MQAAIDQMPAEMLVRHPMSATRPEQCNGLFDWAFINQAWMASYDIRSYRDWFFDADYTPMYTAHRRTLQQLQWKNPGRWVLKYPKHLLSLDALLAEYPDAVLIWTHRDPAKVVPSAISLTSFMRQSNDPELDLVRFGREWVVVEELALTEDSRHVTATPTSRVMSTSITRSSCAIRSNPSAPCARRSVSSSETGPGAPCNSGSTPIRETRTARTATRQKSSVSTPTVSAPALTSTLGGSCDLG